MGDIHWFRRGDGSEFAVQEGSEAYHNLVASGALHISGPGDAGATSATSGPTKAELVARAEELGLSTKGTKAELAAAIAEAEAATETSTEAEGATEEA